MHSSSSMMLSLAFAAAGLLELAPSALASSNANTNIAKRQALQPRHHESSHSHIKNRRHSKMAKKVKAKKDISVLFSGGGLGTLYYDINGGGTCGPVNGWYSYAETGGYAMCEPNSGYETLAQRGSNRVVAIPSNMLQGNQVKYCGKEISVTYNGNTVNNLILWDGCAACNSNGGLDFSSTVFAEVFGESNCGAGKLGGMTWEILDRQIWSTDGTPVAGGGDSSPSQPEPSSTWSAPSSTSTSSSTTEQEEPSTSSTWVESSTTSSSSTWTPSEASTSSSRTPKPKPSKISDAKTEEPVTVVAPTKGKPVFVAKPSTTSSSQTEEAEPTTSASEAVEEPTPEPSSSTTPSPSPSPEAVNEEPAPADTPSDEDDTSGNSCGVAPGTWQCSGNYLRQCVQTLSGWEWLNRVECAEGALINCDSPNPVCTRYIGKRRLPLY